MTKVKKIELDVTGLRKGEVIELLIKDGVSYADAETYWAKTGAKTKTAGFRNLLYSKLIAGDLTDEEVKELARTSGSPNDYKQFSHFSAIARLVAEVRRNIKVSK